jgi:DNA-binding PadR family transcriptional regulator
MSTVKQQNPEPTRRSALSFVLLALLCEHPMHVYGLHKLMLERGQDALVNIEQRNSLQQVLDRLRREGHVEVVADAEAAPSRRVVYRATASGRTLLFDWLHASLAHPRRDYPSLPVAVSLIAFLRPADAQRLLGQRRSTLSREIEALHASLNSAADLPAVFTLEIDLMLHTMRAEAQWLDQTIERLSSGTLRWNPDELLRQGP